MVTQPNIVLFLMDDMAFKELEKMPYTNGRSDWIRFSSAFHNNPLCGPSRVSIFTGRYSHHTGAETNETVENIDEQATFAVWLQSVGYQNAFVGKYLNGYPFNRGSYVPPGWDRWVAYRVSAGYYNYDLYDDRNGVESYGEAPEDYSTDVLAGKGVDFINETAGPFFLQISLFAPHDPRIPAPRHVGTFNGTPVTRSPNFNENNVSDKPLYVRLTSKVNGAQVDEDRRSAWRTLQAVDDAVQAVFDTLTAKGVLENTVVIFSSDNGYMFGEHRLTKKRYEYEECIKNPLLIRYPGQAGRTNTNLVSNVDLAPTFARLAGASVPGNVDGMSLVPLLQGLNPSWRTGVLLRNLNIGGAVSDPDEDTKAPSYWGIRKAGWKYVELDTERELYNITNDPYELTNVANQPAQVSKQAQLASELAQLKS